MDHQFKPWYHRQLELCNVFHWAFVVSQKVARGKATKTTFATFGA